VGNFSGFIGGFAWCRFLFYLDKRGVENRGEEGVKGEREGDVRVTGTYLWGHPSCGRSWLLLGVNRGREDVCRGWGGREVHRCSVISTRLLSGGSGSGFGVSICRRGKGKGVDLSY